MEAKLVVIGGKANMGEVKLRLPMTIGRGKTADLLIAHPTVSREHCRLLEVDGALVVRDNGSSNGVYIDGKKVAGESVVRPGQTLSIGPLTFRAEYEPEADLSKYETEAQERSLADTTATDADEFDFLMDESKPAKPAGKPSKPAAPTAPAGAKGPAAKTAPAPSAPTEVKGKSPAAGKPKSGADETKPVAPAAKSPAGKQPVAKAPAAKAPAPPADVRDTAEVDLDEFWQDEVVAPPAAKNPAGPAAKTPPAAEAPVEAKQPVEAKKPAKAEPPQAPEPKIGPKVEPMIGPPGGPPAAAEEPDFDFLAELDAPAKSPAAPKFEGLPHADDVPDTGAWKVEPAAGAVTDPTDTFNFDELFADEPTATRTTDAEAAAQAPEQESIAEPSAKRAEIEPEFGLETPAAAELPAPESPPLETPTFDTAAATSGAWPAVDAPAPVESRDEDPFDFLKKETEADRETARAEAPVAPADAAPATEPDFDFLSDEPKQPDVGEPEASSSSSATVEMPAIGIDEVAEWAPPVDREPAAAKSEAEIDLSLLEEPASETTEAPPAAEAKGESPVEDAIAVEPVSESWSIPVADEKETAQAAKSDDEFDLSLLEEPTSETGEPPAVVEAESPVAFESEAAPTAEEKFEQAPAAATSDEAFDLSLLDQTSPPPVEPFDAPKAEIESPVSFEPESADTSSEVAPSAWPVAEETPVAPAAAEEKEPDFAAFSFDDDEPVTKQVSQEVSEPVAEAPAATQSVEPEIHWPEPQLAEASVPVIEPAAPSMESALPVESATASEPEHAVGPSAEEESAPTFPDFDEATRDKERAMFSFLDAPTPPAAEAPSAPQEIAAANTSAGATDELDVTSFFDDEPAQTPTGQSPTFESPISQSPISQSPISQSPAIEADRVAETQIAAAPSLPAFGAAPSASPPAKGGAKKPAAAKTSLFDQLKMLFTGKKAKPSGKKPAAGAKPAQAKGGFPGAAAGPVIAAPGFAPPPPVAPIPPADAPIPLADDTMPSTDSDVSFGPLDEGPVRDDGPVVISEKPAQPAFDSIGLADESKPTAAAAEEFPIDFGDEPAADVAAKYESPTASTSATDEKPADAWSESIPPAADGSQSDPWSAVSESPAPEAPAPEAAAAAPDVDWFASDASAPAVPEVEPAMDSAGESAAPAWDEPIASTPTESAGTSEIASSEVAGPTKTEFEPDFDAFFGDATTDADATAPAPQASADAAVSTPSAAAPPSAADDFFSLIDEPASTATPSTPDEQPWGQVSASTPAADSPDAQTSVPQTSVPQSSSPESFDIAPSETPAEESAWSEPQTSVSSSVESEPAWPTEEPTTLAAAASVTESGDTRGAAISDFSPASSPAAVERPRRPQMVDIDLRHSPSTRLLTPVALRRPHVDVPAMVPDVPAGRSFEAKSRPPTPAVEAPVAEPAKFDTGAAESPDLDVTAAWSVSPTLPDMPVVDAANEPGSEPAAASEDWTLDLSGPAAAEPEPSTAEEPMWDVAPSTTSPSDVVGVSPEQPEATEPDLDFFLDDAAAPTEDMPSPTPEAARPWSPPAAVPNAGAAPATDDDALSFLQFDTEADAPRAGSLAMEPAPSEPVQSEPNLANPAPPAPTAAQATPKWDIPVAETAPSAGTSSEDDLDFGFLDLEVTNAEVVEPAGEEPIELALDLDEGAASPTAAEGVPKVAAEDAGGADDPFYFLRKPGEKTAAKPASPAKPAAPQQKDKDKDLDDFLSDLGM